MTEAQIHKFIFPPGFSTAAAVTSVSGRGVGMDVVRNNIDQIGGTVDVKSVPGEGSSFTIKILLTLAIVSALIVEAGGDRFAIPQLSVIELVRAQANSDHRIERIKDTPVLRLRNKLLPLIHLKKLLKMDGAEASEPENGFIVVTQVGNHTFGIVVDGVFHTEEIVAKPMSTKLRHINMFSGNTILGDGSVIMIIDPNGIAQTVGSAATQGNDELDETQQTGDREDRLAAGVPRRLAPAQGGAAVAGHAPGRDRLQEDRALQRRHLVQYRGQLMPLVRVSDEVSVRTEGAQPLLVFSDVRAARWVFVVDEIVDIVEDRLDIQVGSETMGARLRGDQGPATEIIDIGHFLPLAFEDWFRRKEMRPDAPTRTLLFVDDSPRSSATCSSRCSRPPATT